ncbi:MAG: formylmethanofuran dehydrogenase [Methanosarcinales archaeon]|nr:formylmethanofuran dehydrogenase [Methanosarcinales archaeon]
MAVNVGKFIRSPEYDITVVTYRDVFQSFACEEDRNGKECEQLSAVIVLDATEMKHMGVQDGANVKLTSKWGSIVVKAVFSPREEQKGIGFMVNSLWSNALVSDETTDGIPEFKNIKVKIKVSNETIISNKEILSS